MGPPPLSPRDLAALRPSTARLKLLADVLKTYSAVLIGAAIVTPALSTHTLGTVNTVWAIVGVLLLLFAFIIVPEE